VDDLERRLKLLEKSSVNNPIRESTIENDENNSNDDLKF
jgi:hypothetical protein